MLYRVLSSDHISWLDIVLLVIHYIDRIGFVMLLIILLGYYVFDMLKNKRNQKSDLNTK